MTIEVTRQEKITIVAINRPEARNAVNPKTARALFDAFVEFGKDDKQKVAVFTGAGGAFCAGFDLKHASSGMGEDWFAEHDLDESWRDPAADQRIGPMGPTRLLLPKPVIAAISGPAVAGGMELALWADIRILDASAYMGVYCRRWGVPLIDGGTVRLPRIVGHGRAMDMVLTGRKINADECLQTGLANRVCDTGKALETALAYAEELTRFPQACMRADRMSAIRQWSLDPAEALRSEWQSASTFGSEGAAGAARFSSGRGRGGDFGEI